MRLWSVVRWVRAAVFAVACAGLAAGAHLAAGGAVEPLGMGTAFVLMFAPALLLTRGERSTGTILPALALSQVVLHVLFSAGAGQHGTAVPADGMAGVGMAGHGAAGGSPGLGMLLMHAVAVLLAACWLDRGEAALCALVRRMAAWALRSFAWLRPAVRYGPAPTRPFYWVRSHVPARALRHVMALRGPPARPAAALV